MLKNVPHVITVLTARGVALRHNIPNKNTTDIGGAKKPNTDWKTSNRFNPLMELMAKAISTEITALATVTQRPTLITSRDAASGLCFFI